MVQDHVRVTLCKSLAYFPSILNTWEALIDTKTNTI